MFCSIFIVSLVFLCYAYGLCALCLYCVNLCHERGVNGRLVVYVFLCVLSVCFVYFLCYMYSNCVMHVWCVLYVLCVHYTCGM